MNLIELQRALRQLRCSGMAVGLEARLLEAQTASDGVDATFGPTLDGRPLAVDDRLRRHALAARMDD